MVCRLSIRGNLHTWPANGDVTNRRIIQDVSRFSGSVSSSMEVLGIVSYLKGMQGWLAGLKVMGPSVTTGNVFRRTYYAELFLNCAGVRLYC